MKVLMASLLVGMVRAAVACAAVEGNTGRARRKSKGQGQSQNYDFHCGFPLMMKVPAVVATMAATVAVSTAMEASASTIIAPAAVVIPAIVANRDYAAA